MGKLFISFLGTGDYKKCKYNIDGNLFNTDFVQAALIENYCKDWTDNDERIRIFYTAETQKLKSDGSDSNFQRLTQKLQNYHNVEFVLIKSGKSENELWEIFNTVNNEIKNEDEIYLDITHAFRFIPMLSCYILNFAKIQKNITIEHINYGAFDAKDNNDVAPIYELSILDNLFDWSIAMDSFISSGNTGKIKRVGRKKNNNKIDKLFYELFCKIDNFSNNLQLCIRNQINNAIRNIKSLLQVKETKFKNADSSYFIEKVLLDKIKETFDNFSDDVSKNDLYLALWCVEHSLFQQALTIAQETFVRYIGKILKDSNVKFVDDNEIPINEKDEESVINAAIRKLCNGYRDKVENKFNNENVIKNIESVLKDKPNLPLMAYNDLRDRRNQVNHFSDSNNGDANIVKRKIEDFIEEFSKIVIK